MDAMTDKAGLPFETLRRMTENSSDLMQGDRELSENDRRYYSGHQLTEKQKAEYRKRRIPPIVNNRIMRKIDAMVGIEQNGRTDPRAFPAHRATSRRRMSLPRRLYSLMIRRGSMPSARARSRTCWSRAMAVLRSASRKSAASLRS